MKLRIPFCFFKRKAGHIHRVTKLHNAREVGGVARDRPQHMDYSPTMDVGGAEFSLTKTVTISNHDDEQTILVAKGKSYLSYFYVGVCSSVLYLTPEATPETNMILVQHDDNTKQHDTAIVLEIYYHKPARAIDLQWATTKFIESNLPSNINKITNLSPRIQQQILQFNNLYQNI